MAEESNKLGEPQSELRAKDEQYTSVQLKIIHRFLTTGVIKLHPSLQSVPEENWIWDPGSGRNIDPYVVDMDKAVEVLESANDDREVPDISDEKEEQIMEMSKVAFRQAVHALVANEVISPELVVQVGRVVRPTDVKITSEDFARFLYLNFGFPETSGDRADLEIGTRYLYLQVDPFRRMLEENSINLSDEQIMNLILREGITHEYGHAIDHTLEFLQWERHLKSLDDPTQPDFMDYYPIHKKMMGDVFKSIAPNTDLAGLLDGEPEDSTYTERYLSSSERIGRGFQYLGLEYALRDLGIDEERVLKTVDTFKARHQKELDQYRALFKEIRVNNLNLNLVGRAITDIVIEVHRKRDRLDLSDKLGFGIGARDLGYYFALSKDEISEFVKRFWVEDVKEEVKD